MLHILETVNQQMDGGKNQFDIVLEKGKGSQP